MYGIVDCDNCYVSCERVFRPDLEGKVVVVLSNNDGCVVARSNEAKALGIKEGTPYFQLAEQFPNQKIAVFSSNYELYGELTGRVVSIISQEAPAYFRYSIDECFVYLDGMEHINLQKWGENLHKRIKKSVGMPVSIGLAPNKTLAKIASKLAKKFEVYRHCCIIDNDENRIAALKWLPIEDVWGIGRRYAEKLHSLGCQTAYDFAEHHKDWVRQTFNNINIVRTWQELNGEDCVPNEELSKKKSICTSRSFNGMIGDFETLRTNISNYASRCSEKLRKQNTVASIVGVFVSSNPFREDLLQYWNYKEESKNCCMVASCIFDDIIHSLVDEKRYFVTLQHLNSITLANKELRVPQENRSSGWLNRYLTIHIAFQTIKLYFCKRICQARTLLIHYVTNL